MSELSDFFPRFLLNDKNGYALACALLRGMTLMQETVDAGVACVQDVNAMPEWRLDEMAWELGCLYDYSASVDVKREWIRQSTPFAAMNGTPQAIYNYLRGFFERVELEENWLYGGSAFHFRVTVSGEWNARNERWTRMAIRQSQNVRSVLDDLAFTNHTRLTMPAEGGAMAAFRYPRAGELLCGTTL